MPHLEVNPTLTQLQTYQKEVCKERGWDQTSDLETFLLFTEEIGELAKAIRKRKNLFMEEGKDKGPDAVGEEMADILSYLLELANRFEVDLESAYRKKEKVNEERNWS